jgi:hypothetical protein
VGPWQRPESLSFGFEHHGSKTQAVTEDRTYRSLSRREDDVLQGNTEPQEDSMPKYLTIHHENTVDRVLLESRWTEISMDKRALWGVTLFNLEQGRRWCEWEAPNRAAIEKIFGELGIKWTEILEVEVTTAARWRSWEAQSRSRY